MTTPARPPAPVPPGLAAVAGFYRLSVAQYQDMIRNGTLTEDDPVELLDGYLVNKMPQNSPHSSAVERLTEDLGRLKPAGWRLRVQLPITVGESQPEPDVAVVRGARGAYDSRHPTGADFGIVVEVAESSLALDRREKGRAYAEAGIPVYWVVNIPDRQVEVYTDPDPAATPPVYRARTDYRPGDDVPVVLDGAAVAHVPAADLLP